MDVFLTQSVQLCTIVQKVQCVQQHIQLNTEVQNVQLCTT